MRVASDAHPRVKRLTVGIIGSRQVYGVWDVARDVGPLDVAIVPVRAFPF